MRTLNGEVLDQEVNQGEEYDVEEDGDKEEEEEEEEEAKEH